MVEEKTTEEKFVLPPPKLAKWESFKQFLWNGPQHEFLGRNAAKWRSILFFYLIFYTVLATVFALMLVLFYQTLDNFQPKWQMRDSVLGSNPGLGFRPRPKTIESTLLWFKHGDPASWAEYKKDLDQFLDLYERGRQGSQHFKDCDQDRSSDKSCFFTIDSSNWGKCIKEEFYGYRDGVPCILLKLNRIFGWRPEVYNVWNVPVDVKRLLSTPELNAANRTDHSGIVWVTCEGENPADRENLGPATYYPQPGFGASYFPYKNVQGYVSPIVFVQFDSVEKGVLINVECKAWAKNIQHGRQERRGSVHFELMID